MGSRRWMIQDPLRPAHQVLGKTDMQCPQILVNARQREGTLWEIAPREIPNLEHPNLGNWMQASDRSVPRKNRIMASGEQEETLWQSLDVNRTNQDNVANRGKNKCQSQ